jgi:hypothetical protein
MTRPPEIGVFRERVVRRECRRCGKGFAQRSKGRPAMCCAPACKQQPGRYGTRVPTKNPPRHPPAVVRDIVERTLVPRPTAPDWSALLGMLTEHISDDRTALAREHSPGPASDVARPAPDRTAPTVVLQPSSETTLWA